MDKKCEMRWSVGVVILAEVYGQDYWKGGIGLDNWRKWEIPTWIPEAGLLSETHLERAITTFRRPQNINLLSPHSSMGEEISPCSFVCLDTQNIYSSWRYRQSLGLRLDSPIHKPGRNSWLNVKNKKYGHISNRKTISF